MTFYSILEETYKIVVHHPIHSEDVSSRILNHYSSSSLSLGLVVELSIVLEDN